MSMSDLTVTMYIVTPQPGAYREATCLNNTFQGNKTDYIWSNYIDVDNSVCVATKETIFVWPNCCGRINCGRISIN